ncbi:MAG: peptidyl-tRNA hydrolase [bacterium]
MRENSKLIVITRSDIDLGSQAVQSSHAAIQFIYEHPEIAKQCYNISNYLVLLSVKNKKELLDLVDKFDQRGIHISKFHEPDLGNELTSIAIEPTSRARRLVSSLPLLLKTNY